MSKLLDNLKNNNSMEVTMELTSTRLVLSYLFNPNAHRLKPVSENITIQDNKKAVD